MVLFQTIGRVGFVAFSKVADCEEDRRQAQRVLGVTALAAAALLAAIVAGAPALVGCVLGRKWEAIIVPANQAASLVESLRTGANRLNGDPSVLPGTLAGCTTPPAGRVATALPPP